MLTWVWIACAPPPEVDTSPEDLSRPWSPRLPPAAETLPPDGLFARRTIVHLHSPWSHDACDGEPLIDGVPDEQCLEDLRRGLCQARIDQAFVTDHPAHAAAQAYNDLFLARAGDRDVVVDGALRYNEVACDDAQRVIWAPGIEDELMPIGLHRQVDADPETADAIYNGYDADTVHAELGAGGAVFTAHTEGRSLDDLSRLQDAGLVGTEVFNLHAAFDPDIREEHLGLDGFGWFGEIGDFIGTDGAAEPDLFVLAVLAEQAPSVERWDALLARGPMVGTVGTDAHQNVMPVALRDGERGDSYRRMLRWMSNVVWSDTVEPEDTRAALVAGRSMVVFEILGTPAGFDFRLEGGPGVVRMGGTGVGTTLVVDCPVLSESSPRGVDDPDVRVTIFKDGAAWGEGCGAHAVHGAGVYRARVDLTPVHLRPFLGVSPDVWLRAYPWIYANAIRVTG